VPQRGEIEDEGSAKRGNISVRPCCSHRDRKPGAVDRVPGMDLPGNRHRPSQGGLQFSIHRAASLRFNQQGVLVEWRAWNALRGGGVAVRAHGGLGYRSAPGLREPPILTDTPGLGAIPDNSAISSPNCPAAEIRDVRQKIDHLTRESIALRTQLRPPHDDGSQGYGGGEVGGELVVAGGAAALVLEPAKHALDQGAHLVGVRIERIVVPAGRIVGNDRWVPRSIGNSLRRGCHRRHWLGGFMVSTILRIGTNTPVCLKTRRQSANFTDGAGGLSTSGEANERAIDKSRTGRSKD
jgi:hypothetical protein